MASLKLILDRRRTEREKRNAESAARVETRAAAAKAAELSARSGNRFVIPSAVTGREAAAARNIVLPPVVSPKVSGSDSKPVPAKTKKNALAGLQGIVSPPKPFSGDARSRAIADMIKADQTRVAADKERKAREFEELKRSSQGSERKPVELPVLRRAPAKTKEEVLAGLKGIISPQRPFNAFEAQGGLTMAQPSIDAEMKRRIENAEESAATRARIGFHRGMMPGNVDDYLESMGMTPEKKAMLEGSGAYNAGQMAGFVAGSIPFSVGGAGAAGSLAAKVGAKGLARSAMMLGGEALANMPQNLDIAINKDHLTDPAEIAKSMLINTGLDVGLGIAGEGVGAARKAYKSAGAARIADDEYARAEAIRAFDPGNARARSAGIVEPPIINAKAAGSGSVNGIVDAPPVNVVDATVRPASPAPKSSGAAPGMNGEVIAPAGAKKVPHLKDQIRPRIKFLEKTNPVYSGSSASAAKNDAELIKDVTTYYENFGYKVDRPFFGSVEVNKNGLLNSLNHRNSNAKRATFEAVPFVIRDGVEIYRDPNHKNLGFDTFTFAGKVLIDDKPAYIGVIVRNTEDVNRFYVHAVLDENGKVYEIDPKKIQTGEIKGRGTDDPAVPTDRFEETQAGEIMGGGVDDPSIPTNLQASGGTAGWLQGIGLRLPSRVAQGGSFDIDNIPQSAKKVNNEFTEAAGIDPNKIQVGESSGLPSRVVQGDSSDMNIQQPEPKVNAEIATRIAEIDERVKEIKEATFNKDGTPPEANQILKNEELAKAFRELRELSVEKATLEKSLTPIDPSDIPARIAEINDRIVKIEALPLGGYASNARKIKIDETLKRLYAEKDMLEKSTAQQSGPKVGAESAETPNAAGVDTAAPPVREANPPFAGAHTRMVDVSDLPAPAPRTENGLKAAVRNVFGAEDAKSPEARRIDNTVKEILYLKDHDLYNEDAARGMLSAAVRDTPVLREPNALMTGFAKEARSVRIRVSDDLKAAFPDYERFRKDNWGTLTLAGNGVDVSDVYAALRAKYPSMLDSRITDPAEQLTEISKRLKFISGARKAVLGDFLSDEEIERTFVAPALEEFENFFTQKPDVRSFARDDVDMFSDAADEIYGKVGPPLGFAEDARMIGGSDIASGFHRFTDLDRNIDRFLGKEGALRERFDEKFTNPFIESKGRNAERIVAQADKLYDTVVDKKKGLGIKPGSRESAAVQWYGEKQRQVRDARGRIVIEDAPQKIDRNGKPVTNFFGRPVYEKGKPVTEKYTLEDLKTEFPDRWEAIVEAERYVRGVYDSYIKPIQDFLKAKYPDVEKNVERIRAIGAKENIVIGEPVRSDITGARGIVTDISPEGWYEVTFGKKGAQGGTVAALNRSDILRERTWNKIQDEYRNRRLFPRDDYFHHMAERGNSNMFGDISEFFRSGALIDPGLVRFSEFTKPNSRFAPFLQPRYGGEYAEDAVGGIMRYIVQAEHKLNIEPHITTLRAIAREVENATADTKNANSFIEFLDDLAGELAGKTAPLDRTVAHGIFGSVNGRRFLNTMMRLSSPIRINAVAGNLRTILVQAGSLPNLEGYVKGKDRALVAANLVNASRAMIRGNKKIQAKLAKSNFIRERFMSRSVRKFDVGRTALINEALSRSLELGDELVVKAGFLTFYDAGIREGLDDAAAVLRADMLTRKSVAGRGIGEMPQHQRAKLTKILFPFQVEPMNDLNLIIEKIGEKRAVDLLSVFGARALLNAGLAIVGVTVGFDPIGKVIESIKEGYDKGASAADTAKAAAGRVAGNAFSNIPLGSNLVDAFKNNAGISDAAMSKFFFDEDPSRYGTGNMAAQTVFEPIGDIVHGRQPDFLHPILSFAPRGGGRQIERTVRGLQDMAVLPDVKIQNLWNGGEEPVVSKREFPASYNQKGALRFPIEPTPLNYGLAGTLGSFATPEGKDYLARGYSPLSDKQTSTVEEAYKKSYIANNLPIDVTVAALHRRMEADKDGDGNGGVKDSELSAYVSKIAKEYGLSAEQQRLLWRIVSGKAG